MTKLVIEAIVQLSKVMVLSYQFSVSKYGCKDQNLSHEVASKIQSKR